MSATDAILLVLLLQAGVQTPTTTMTRFLQMILAVARVQTPSPTLLGFPLRVLIHITIL
jgi:hypothetical protein